MYDCYDAPLMSGKVAAYFDLDGTCLIHQVKNLNCSIGKTSFSENPNRYSDVDIGLVGNLIRGRSFYDAARNRGHFFLASWSVLEKYSKQIAEEIWLTKSQLKKTMS